MLDKFQEAQQVLFVYSSKNKKTISKTAYSRFEGVVKEYTDKYDLIKYLN
jgi:hypothetical protein